MSAPYGSWPSPMSSAALAAGGAKIDGARYAVGGVWWSESVPTERGRMRVLRQDAEGTVHEVSFLGSVIRLKVDLGGNTLSLDTFNDQRTPPPAHGARVKVGIAAGDVLVLDN